MEIIFYSGLAFSSIFFIFESRMKRCLTEKDSKLRLGCLIPNIILNIIIVLLISANRDGYDSQSYQRFFNYTSTMNSALYDYTYITFGNIIYLVKKWMPQISYFEFQAFLTIILGIVVKYRLSEYTLSYRVFCFLYLLSGTIAADGMQFKNYIAVFFLMIAMPCLVKEDNNVQNTVLYCTFVIIAALFHFSFIIYLVLVAVRWVKEEKIEKAAKILVLLGLVVFIFLYVFPGFLPGVLNIIAKIPGLSKLSNYSFQNSGRRALPPLAIYFAQLLLLKYCMKTSSDYQQKIQRFTKVVWIINLLTGILLPGLLYANAAFRLYRNIYILNFIVYSNCIVRSGRLGNRRIIFSLAVIAACILIFIYPNILLNQRGDIIDAMLDGEYFWVK